MKIHGTDGRSSLRVKVFDDEVFGKVSRELLGEDDEDMLRESMERAKLFDTLYRQEEQIRRLKIQQNTLEKRLKEKDETIQELQNHVFNDALTGIGNKVSFERDFIRLLQGEDLRKKSNQRETDPVSDHVLTMYLIDMNNFKPINDTYGHNAGDEALKEVAKRLKKVSRDNDLVARIGGDEFLMATLAPRDEDIIIARRIYDSISSEPLIYTESGNKNIIDLSASIGAVSLYSSSYKISIETLTKIKSIADTAMYCSKCDKVPFFLAIDNDSSNQSGDYFYYDGEWLESLKNVNLDEDIIYTLSSYQPKSRLISSTDLEIKDYNPGVAFIENVRNNMKFQIPDFITPAPINKIRSYYYGDPIETMSFVRDRNERKNRR